MVVSIKSMLASEGTVMSEPMVKVLGDLLVTS